MATNPYFNSNQFFGSTPNEQTLYDQLAIESIQIFGFDVYYVLRNKVKEDSLFGEDVLSSFKEYHIVEMYLKNAEEYLGADKFLDKFGYNRDSGIELDYVITRFTEITGRDKPMEGDLLWVPQMKRLFEIRRTDSDALKPRFATITAELFTPSHEDIDIVDAEDISKLTDALHMSSENAKTENTKIQTEANTILDFSESNPFGELDK